MTRAPAGLFAIVTACTSGPSIIGETAESGDTGNATAEDTSGDASATAEGTATSATDGSDDGTAGAPSDCEAPCVWTVALEGVDVENLHLEVDADDVPLLVSGSISELLVHRFTADGETMSPPAVFGDVPTDGISLVYFTIEPGGAVAAVWAREPDGYHVQRRTSDALAAAWTAVAAGSNEEEGLFSEFATGLHVGGDGSVHVAYVRTAGTLQELFLAAYSANGVPEWGTELDEYPIAFPEMATDDAGGLFVWAVTGSTGKHFRSWHRHADGEIDANDVMVSESMLTAPARRGDGWVLVGQADDDDLGGGVSIRLVDADLTPAEPVVDWPASADGYLQPRDFRLVGDRVAVLTHVSGPTASLQLRTYGLDGALQDAAPLAAVHPDGTVGGDVYDMAVASDGSLYVLGSDLTEDSDFHYWLRRFAW